MKGMAHIDIISSANRCILLMISILISEVSAQAPEASQQVTTIVLILVFLLGPVLLIGIIAIYKAGFDKESEWYKCKCITGEGNAGHIIQQGTATQDMSQLTEEQRRLFQANNVAKPKCTKNRGGWHTPPEKVGKTFEDLQIGLLEQATAGERPREHILISYERDVLNDVLEFRNRLRAERYRVWVDEEQLRKHGGTRMEAMSKGIEKACVVVPVLTERYQASEQCRKEIEYADKCKKIIVPVRMQKKYRPEGWLGFLLGNTLWHDLANENTYQAQIDNFLESLEDHAKNAKVANDDFDDY